MLSWPVSDQTPISLAYARAAPAPLNAPTLDTSVRADVAVVGAGFTGLSTALHLAQQGVPLPL